MSRDIQHASWRRLAPAIAGVLLAAGGLAAVASGPPQAAAASGVMVRVYPQLQYQTVQGWGTSLAWWAEATANWSSANRTALADKLFDPVKGIGLNVVRYNLGGVTPTDSCASTFRVGAAVPSYEQSNGVYDWSQDAGQRWWLQAAQDRGADQLTGVAYSPPAWMTVSGCSAGATTANTDNLAPANYQEYATYLATVARHFHDVWGLPLSTLAPFNEPDGSWTEGISQEGMSFAPSSQSALIKTIHDTLSSGGDLGFSRLSAPESGWSFDVARWLRGPGAPYDSTATSDIAQVNTHEYANAEGGSVYQTAQGLGVPIMMSEWGASAASSNAPDMAAGIALSQRILKNEREMHPESWVIWQALDGGAGLGSCNDLWGLACADMNPGSNQQVSYPARYWVMGNYSKFVRPGATVIAGSDPGTLAAYDPGRSTLTLVTTNASSSQQSYAYDLSGFDAVGASATPYQTTATEQLAPKAPVAVTGKSFTTTLPAQSVTTFVIPGVSYAGAGAATQVDDAVQGTGPNQFDYSGSGWQHCSGSACGDPQDLYAGTTSWSGNAGDTVTFRFDGVQARLYGVRDSNGGIGDVSVDGGPSTEVDFYAHSRAGNALMWQSPLLPSGSHTITLRVSGTKNPQSSGYLIALDRAEVRPQPAGTPGGLVTSTRTGSIRNNFAGQAGMEFTTGTSQLTVRALGRSYLSGADTQPHTVALYRASDGTLVASASVQTGSGANPDAVGFTYQHLGRPVTLAPNTSYILVSSETSGGDPFFDADTTVKLAPGVTADGPAWRSGRSGSFTVYTSDAGQAYGPVSMIANAHSGKPS
jgi:O-glycosyl hydrolase